MLTAVEGRVLGCLMEKERTLPDQYPLTMNALLTACNQSTSRDPVLRLGEHEVLAAVTSLKSDGYVRLVHPSHGRSATRYRHVADERLGIEPAASAVVAVLLLRGAQTSAELRARTERQHAFRTIDEVEEVLRGLAQRELVRLLGRTPGRKEPRWQQLVAQDHGAPGHDAPDHGAPGHDAPERDAPDGADAASERPVVLDDAGSMRAEPDVGHRPGAHGDVPAPTASRGDEELARRVLELEDRVARLEAALRDLL